MRESLERKRRCRTSLVCTSTTPPPPREGCSAVCRASFLSAGGEMCCSRVVVVVRLIIPAPPPPPPILNICAQQPSPPPPHQPSPKQSICPHQNQQQCFFSSRVSHLSQRETCGSIRFIVLPFSVFINGFAVWELFMGLFLALFYWLLFNGMHGNKSSDWEQLLHLRKAKAKIYKRSSG